MAKIDTLFMTKTAEKPYPLGSHIPMREYPPSPGAGTLMSLGICPEPTSSPGPSS